VTAQPAVCLSMEYDDDGEALDPANFSSYPTLWDFQLEVGSNKIAVYKNPLGALHRCAEEITSFYMPREEIETSKQRPVYYVLIVTYAGSPMCECPVVYCHNEEGLSQGCATKNAILSINLRTTLSTSAS
jgi:hypothetical protein